MSPILDPEINNRIVGGAPAVPGTTPFMVSLQWVMRADTRQHFCGGCIVGQKWVLTAANCVSNNLPVVGRLEVVAGLHALDDWTNAQSRVVSAIIINDNYNVTADDPVGTNDLAMLFHEEDWTFNQFVTPIVLPAPNQVHEYYVTILGWGDTATSGEPSFPNVLQSTTTPLVPYAQCDELIGQGRTPLANTNLCTGPLVEGGVGFCTGDSGGPLVQQNQVGTYELVGIASWGFSPCGSINAPSVFTRASAYNAWIYNVMT